VSFSFSAQGTKEETLSSVNNADVYGNAIGEEAKKLVAAAIEADGYDPGPNYAMRWSVSASGHSYAGPGSAPTVLSLTIGSQAVPKVDVNQ
jgi:hypothetical protein